MAKKRAKRLTLDQALERVDKMMPLLHRDIDIAVAEYGAMEAANDIVVGELKDVPIAGADCFSIVQQALAHSLALRLAKLLEVPTPRQGSTVAYASNRSDLASLPLALRFVMQKRCRKVFAARARRWTPALAGMAETNSRSCLRAIEEAATEYGSFAKSKKGRLALRKLRDFRNFALAHNLLSQSKEHFPTYDQIFDAQLMVCRVWEGLRLAVNGEHWDMNAFISHQKDVGTRFWKPALRAVRRDKSN